MCQVRRKGPQTARWKSIYTKRNVQTADKTTRFTQDRVTSIKRKGNIRSETQEECNLPGNKETIVGSYMGENTHASVARRVDLNRQINQDSKFKQSV